jgi:hypothetical protein
VTEAFVAAARLPQADPDHAAGIGQAEGQATLALLRALGDGDWTRPIGAGDPVAVVRADAVAYVRALSGRGDDVALDLLSGQASALPSIRQARVAF